MDPSVIRRTQETLGKVIKKPPLTDKLLGKPPFRYLHDILTEVIRTTGFLKGLYTESELKSDNVKDKDSKISFLQKVIDVVVLVTGEPLAVKPARIVAGHEPERTNELLQAIGKCCLNKLSGDDAVRRILAGEKADLKGKPPSSSKSHDKENRDAKDEEHKNLREKEDRKESEIQERSRSSDRKDRSQRKEDERKHPERDRERKKERDSATEAEKDGLREGEKNDKENSKVKESHSELEKERSGREKGRERRSEGSRGKDREKDREREKDRTKDREKGREKDRDRNREGDPERERRKERIRQEDTTRDEDRPPEPEKLERKHKSSENSSKKTAEVPVKESKTATDREKVARPSASKLRDRRPARPGGGGVEDSGSDQELGATETLAPENSDVPDGQHNQTMQRRIPRPGSARPAAPRVKRQGSTETLPQERNSSGTAISNVILDKQKKEDDDDDDEFVVEEASPHPPDMPEIELDPELTLIDDGKHGSLVNKILETKKDYETQPDAANKDKLLLSDAGKKKEKDLVMKEIEKLRSSIQTLCRSALPLGKIMDYIQEDMDTMQNELQTWRQENRQHAEELLREQSVTDTAVEPLKTKLVELEQLIKEQQDKICTVKGNILRNEEKIKKMVQSVSVTS